MQKKHFQEQTVSDDYRNSKDVGNKITEKFNWVGSILDTFSYKASSISFVGNTMQKSISDLRSITDFDGMITNFPNNVEQVINTFFSF